MAWCKKIEQGKEYVYDNSIQYFTEEEWDVYPFAGEEKP